MSQWRDAESHTIDPKFVFTTGTNPDYGLKALIVPGDWMVKSHGGESQQFHYTGLNNPLMQPSLSGPNNLGADALTFYDQLVSRGHLPEDFLFYLAGIYNSQMAEDYLEGGGANVLRIPLSPSLIESGDSRRVIDLARRLRNLHWVSVEAESGIEATLAESLLDRDMLVALALDELGGSGGRFRQSRMWRSTPETDRRVDAEVSRLRPELDEAVADLFSVDPRPRSTLIS